MGSTDSAIRPGGPDGGGDGGAEGLTASARRRIGVRIFSSASDAPRARRPTDVALVILTVVIVALLSIPAPGPTQIDTAITSLSRIFPGLFGWFWEIGYDLLIVWALALIGIALFAHRRKALLRDLLCSGVLSFLIALFVGKLAGTDWSKSLDAMTASHGPAVYMAVRLCFATAVIVTASPHMTHALRIVGRGVLLAGGGLGDRPRRRLRGRRGRRLRGGRGSGRTRPPDRRVAGRPADPGPDRGRAR